MFDIPRVTTQREHLEFREPTLNMIASPAGKDGALTSAGVKKKQCYYSIFKSLHSKLKDNESQKYKHCKTPYFDAQQVSEVVYVRGCWHDAQLLGTATVGRC